MDFISRNSTENQEPEENYEYEIVINAIAQLATVKVYIGRFFNQDANTENETNMHETCTLIDTRRYQTNKGYIDSKYHILQPLIDTITLNF